MIWMIHKRESLSNIASKLGKRQNSSSIIKKGLTLFNLLRVQHTPTCLKIENGEAYSMWRWNSEEHLILQYEAFTITWQMFPLINCLIWEAILRLDFLTPTIKQIFECDMILYVCILVTLETFFFPTTIMWVFNLE